MPSREWPLRIQDILQAIAHVQQVTAEMTLEEFVAADEIIRQGILYNFIIIGEASVNVPDAIQSRYPQIPWRVMRDMRNVMAHEYFQVTLRRVWDTIQNDLPLLKQMLEELQEREFQED